jgi:hypothetical protein
VITLINFFIRFKNFKDILVFGDIGKCDVNDVWEETNNAIVWLDKVSTKAYADMVVNE